MEQKYLGITPYDENGQFDFVGRFDETWALYDRISRNDFTVYYAASGEGKSSLIRAGLIPILRRRDYFPLYIVFNDSEINDTSSIKDIIFRRIADNEKIAAASNVTFEQSLWSKAHFSEEQSLALRDNIWWKLRNYCFKRGDQELKPLYIFDQFEEVFTKASYEWTDCFFDWLEEISTDYVPESVRTIAEPLGVDDMPTQKNFKALFSFRTEYLGDLDYWCVEKHFLPSLQDNRICLKPLTPKGAMEVINLNQQVLGKYADKIMAGCAVSGDNINVETQPCIYALILSVVCQTLSNVSSKERISILEELERDQNKAIDEVLLRFYNDKLIAAGLDLSEDEHIIDEMEKNLIQDGKRNRRDTSELPRSLSKWIERLSNKENGLIKIIGSKHVNGETVKTVEFPHDRLCKAIDSHRKERQEKNNFRLKRQAEWMQFGIIASIMAIIAFLWNSMMSEIRLVMSYVMALEFKSIEKFWASFCSLVTNSDAEGFLSVILMLILLLFFPIIIFSTSSKEKKWTWTGLCCSITGSIIIILVYALRLRESTFSNSFIPFIALVTLIICLAFSIFFGLRIVNLNRQEKKLESSVSLKEHNAIWPLLGGFTLFFCYLFYELLRRTTFGTNEPCDSAWMIPVLPTLLAYFFWSLFHMRRNNEKMSRTRLLFCVILFILSLCVLSCFNWMPAFSEIRQRVGFPLSVLAIVASIISMAYVYLNTSCKTKHFELTRFKQWGATTVVCISVLLLYFLNLGYNPFQIRPSNVCYIANWRNVMVCSRDSSGNRILLGMVDPMSGDEIIPCCINITTEYSYLLGVGYHPFYRDGKFKVKVKDSGETFESSLDKNSDESLLLDYRRDSLTGLFVTSPIMEYHLYKVGNQKFREGTTLKDSIDICAARLINELRKSNLEYLVSGKKYSAEDISSLALLDSLQNVAFTRQLKGISDSVVFEKFSPKRLRADVLQDQDLVGLYRELSRSIIICLIRDRISHQDIPALFTISSSLPLAYLSDLEGSQYRVGYNFNSNLTQSKSINIWSDDLHNHRFYSWYNFFDMLCKMDLGFNSKSVSSRILLKYKDRLDLAEQNVIDDINNLRQTAADTPDDELSSMLDEELRIAEDTYALIESIFNFQGLSIADTRLSLLTENTNKCLFELIKKDYNAVYNNAFENTIQNLILLSLMRGHDVENFTDEMSSYFEEKGKFYQGILDPTPYNNEAIGLIEEAIETIDEIHRKMNTILLL